MSLLTSHTPKLIDITEVSSESGSLWYAEVGRHLPFVVQRIYYIIDVPEGAERGAHAHKALDQVLISVSGSFVVDLTDGVSKWSYTLNHPGKGLFLPAGIWRGLQHFSTKAICLVLASQTYDASDYIRDFDEFLAWKSK